MGSWLDKGRSQEPCQVGVLVPRTGSGEEHSARQGDTGGPAELTFSPPPLKDFDEKRGPVRFLSHTRTRRGRLEGRGESEEASTAEIIKACF